MEKRPQFFSFDLVCNQNTFEMVVQIILHFGWSHHFEFSLVYRLLWPPFCRNTVLFNSFVLKDIFCLHKIGYYKKLAFKSNIFFYNDFYVCFRPNFNSFSPWQSDGLRFWNLLPQNQLCWLWNENHSLLLCDVVILLKCVLPMKLPLICIFKDKYLLVCRVNFKEWRS